MPAALAPDIVGCETPRLYTKPRRELTPETSLGFEATTFAERLGGVQLLPWQRWLFEHALELDDTGGFRFRTVLVLVGRQAGKSTWAKFLALWRMYVDDAKLVLGTAQNLDVSEALWRDAVEIAENSPALAKQIAQVEMSSGRKCLTLTGGRRYKVQSANRRGGRGMSGDLVLLDELREHQTWDAWSAVSKTTIARPRAQIVCLSNAGDDNSVVLNDLRARALDMVDDPTSTLGIFEWSAPEDCDITDPANWAQATPALGHTIQPESIAAALQTDPPKVFRTEVLCQRVEHMNEAALPLWPQRTDTTSRLSPGDPVAFAVDVSWDRSTSWITAAGRRPDGLIHVEIVATGEGTDWVPDRLQVLTDKWQPVAVAMQANGAPVSSLGLPDAVMLSGSDIAKGCGQLFDAVANARLVHTGQEQLADAAKLATIRAFGDGWLFDRKRSPVDAAPLLAAAEALWALNSAPPRKKTKAPRRLR